MHSRDRWARRAADEGYRSRAAYKLRQLDESHELFAAGQVVVDLGAAPGGWSQIAAEAVGASGTVLAVDRKRIEPFDRDGIERMQGDLTKEETIDDIAARADGADVVISDMAPNMSGEYELDHARSIHLAQQAASTAAAVLAPGGDFVVKVFEGRDLADLRNDLETQYRYVAAAEPEASRDASSEVYLIGKDYLAGPVAAGERYTVTIEETGAEGDGIAKIEGFTVFVPDAGVDEDVTIEIEDVKPRFAFASIVNQ